MAAPRTALVLVSLLLVPLGTGLAPLEDDAGSGRDAPEGRPGAVPVRPGVVYEAAFTGAALGVSLGDVRDVYAFEAQPGDVLEVRFLGAALCYAVTPAAPPAVIAGCWTPAMGPVRVTLPQGGTWHLDLSSGLPQPYRFAFQLDGPAPEPNPTGAPRVDAGAGAPATGLSTVAPASQAGPHVVIAVVDTGINPYHELFRAPALVDHPSTWLPGFPASATQVGLSLDASSQAEALAADASKWSGLQRSVAHTSGFTTRLYSFPGTRVVGAVSFGEYSERLGGGGTRPVLDEHGHGTHSAALALGAHLGAADGNVLLVMVEVGQSYFVDGVRWAARQPWIDAISVSLGVVANVPYTTSPLTDRRGMEWATLEAHASGKPVFMASGNGVSGTGVAPDPCSTYTSPYTGPSYVTRVGAAEPRSGNAAWWHCLPVEVAARTPVQSARHDAKTGAAMASGTSAATPNVAGHYAHLLLDARRSGSPLPRHEVLQHLLNASAPADPSVGVGRLPSFDATDPAAQGYGLVDRHALARARASLLAGEPPTPRPELDRWVAEDRALRDVLWGPGSHTARERHPYAWDDAGSGRDAPEDPAAAIPVEAGVVHRGAFERPNIVDVDQYRLPWLAPGDVVEAHARGVAGTCLRLADGAGNVLGSTCASGMLPATLRLALTGSGPWVLRVHGMGPQSYAFAADVGSAPEPTIEDALRAPRLP